MKKYLRIANFQKVLQRLQTHFGPQYWWPARSSFEVCVGAILTQNTAWNNVERAISNLRKAQVLIPHRLFNLTYHQLAHLLRPSGYFNIKTQRLKAFLSFYKEKFHFSIARMKQQNTETLRKQLLEISGIGRETADSILLYALEKPIFVVDAYTRRIFTRHRWIHGHEDYDEIRLLVERSWKEIYPHFKIRDYNELHALLVAVGKSYCHPHIPLCCKCPLQKMLPKESRLTCS